MPPSGPAAQRGARAHADRLAAILALDLRPCWSPTRAAYLDKVSKQHILAAVAEIAGEARAEGWAGLKKEALVEPLLTEARWLPEPLRTSAAMTKGEVASWDEPSDVATPGMAT
jgi:hypothetical protein